MRYQVREFPRDAQFPFRVLDTRKVVHVACCLTRDEAAANAERRNGGAR